MESEIRVVPLYTEFDQLEFVHLITLPKITEQINLFI